MTAEPDTAVRGALSYRPVRRDELEVCTEIWRESINDYTRRLNLPDLESETGPLLRLYTHLQSTDPERFVVATLDERIVGFASAVVRERLWYLSMCFVLPEMQRRGVARSLIDRIAPADDTGVRATGTDSAQPISNALYASMGMVPRVPLLNLIGLPIRPEAFGSLPSGLTQVPFEILARDDHDRLAATVDALDRELLGVAHPIDHAYLRRENRRGWLYRGPDGAPVAYGYATEAGRIGPIASRDATLLAPIIGHLTSAVTPRGAFATWLPGTAGDAVAATLRAGLRLDQFPVLLCWDRPFADLSRYIPISPGLL